MSSALHPFLVHFPLALLAYGLLWECIARFRSPEGSHFAQRTLEIGLALCLPTIVTGWLAGASLPADPSVARALQLHTMAGLGCFFTAALYTGMRGMARLGEWQPPRAVTVVAAMFVVVFLLAVGLSGGRLTRHEVPAGPIAQGAP